MRWVSAFTSPHCWCWMVWPLGASWVTAPHLSGHFFNHSVNKDLWSQKKGVSDFLLGPSKWMVLYEEYALANYSSANWWKAAAGKVSHANQLMEHVVVSKYRMSRTPNFLLFLALLPAFVVWLPRLFLMLVPALIVILCRAGLNLVLLFLLTPCWFSASDWLTWRLTDWQVEEKESKRCKRSRQIPFIGSKLQCPLTLSA